MVTEVRDEGDSHAGGGSEAPGESLPGSSRRKGRWRWNGNVAHGERGRGPGVRRQFHSPHEGGDDLGPQWRRATGVNLEIDTLARYVARLAEAGLGFRGGVAPPAHARPPPRIFPGR